MKNRKKNIVIVVVLCFYNIFIMGQTKVRFFLDKLPKVKNQNFKMIKIKFRQTHKGTTLWTRKGEIISTKKKLRRLEYEIENKGPLIVEHWHFYGASAPSRYVFDSYEDFIEYLTTHAIAGDAIHIWSFAEVCKEDTQFVYGKCPNINGMIPIGGAY